MSNLLLPLFDHIIISRPGTFKKSDPESLFLLFKKEIGDKEYPRLYLEKDAKKALLLALECTPGDGAILCTGSFYLAGEIAQAYRQLKDEALEEAAAICP